MLSAQQIEVDGDAVGCRDNPAKLLIELEVAFGVHEVIGIRVGEGKSKSSFKDGLVEARNLHFGGSEGETSLVDAAVHQIHAADEDLAMLVFGERFDALEMEAIQFEGGEEVREPGEVDDGSFLLAQVILPDSWLFLQQQAIFDGIIRIFFAAGLETPFQDHPQAQLVLALADHIPDYLHVL